MVLQADHGSGTRAELYGTADAGDNVTVSVEYIDDAQQRTATQYAAVTNGEGSWEVFLQPEPLRTRATITVKVPVSDPALEANYTVRLQDVLWGDVLLCSGQSNMQFQVESTIGALEAESSASHSNLRMLGVHRSDSIYLEDDVSNLTFAWGVGNNAHDVKYFSAVCYYAGRDLLAYLGDDYPLGLVASAYGGTYIEEWITPQDALACGYVPFVFPNGTASDKWFLGGGPPKYVAATYDAMVYPLRRLAVRAIFWYQGEENVHLHSNYACALERWVALWRSIWGSSTWIFHVQIGAYPSPGHKAIGCVRAVQNEFQPGGRHDVGRIAVVPAYDTFDSNLTYGVHSRYKQPVGYRLAQAAAYHLYSVGSVAHSGPRLQSAVLAANNSVVLTFKFANGLRLENATNGDCGLNRTSFVLANRTFDSLVDASKTKFVASFNWSLTSAEIGRIDNDTAVIVLTSFDYPPGAPPPLAVAYAIDDIPQCVLMNAAGLPAPAFVAPLPCYQASFGGSDGVASDAGGCRLLAAANTAVTTSGTTGTSGTSGTIGSTGTTGTTGTVGTSGTTGSSGSTGTVGTTGTTGSSGSTGSVGTSGTTGSSGSTGTVGTSGSSGTSGTSGSTDALTTQQQPATTGGMRGALGWTTNKPKTGGLVDSEEEDSTHIGKTFVYGLGFAAVTIVIVAYFAVRYWRRQRQRQRNELSDADFVVLESRPGLLKSN